MSYNAQRFPRMHTMNVSNAYLGIAAALRAEAQAQAQRDREALDNAEPLVIPYAATAGVHGVHVSHYAPAHKVRVVYRSARALRVAYLYDIAYAPQ